MRVILMSKKNIQALLKKVKELKLKGLKQIDIARELNITKGTVSKYSKVNAKLINKFESLAY